MSFWGSGYWGSGYWGSGYWNLAEDSDSFAITLYRERVVTVVKLNLARIDGTGTDSFLVSEEFWRPGSLYTGNPMIYPVLADPVATPRGFDGPIGIRSDVQISLLGKTHFDLFGRGFVDLAQLYQIRNSTAEVYRYLKSKDGLGTPMTGTGIRQTLELTGMSFDPPSGILRINARDTWYEDKEISKKLDPTLTGFSAMQEDRQYEYAAIPFGKGEGGQGVVIDSPYILGGEENDILADLFLGFGDANHPVDSVQRFFKKNNHKAASDEEYPQVTFPASVIAQGDWTSGAAGETPGRYLSLYSRAVIYQPTTPGYVLSSVFADLSFTNRYPCADFSGANNFYRIGGNPFTFNEKSFSVCFKIYFDTLRQQGIMGKGNLSDGTAEWFIYMNSSNKITFGISCDGLKNACEVSWGTAASASTWYQGWCWYDAAAATLNLSVNNGTTVSVSTVVNSGALTGGHNSDDDNKTYLQFASSASSTNGTYNAFKTKITSGDAVGDEKLVLVSSGSPKRGLYENNWSPLPDIGDTYQLIAFPSTKLGDEEKDGPFQIGYVGGITNHLDGRMCSVGIFREVVSSTVRTSIYNSGNGKAHEHLTDSEKSVDEGFQLISWWDMDELLGDRHDSQGSTHLTDAGQVGCRTGTIAVNPDNEKGDITVSVYLAKYLPTEETYTEDGSPLASVKYEPSDVANLVASGTPAPFPFTPIELILGQSYMVVLSWSNHNEPAYSPLCNYSAAPGTVHLAKLHNGDDDRGWKWQDDIDLAIQLNVIADSSTPAFFNSVSAPYYAHYRVKAAHDTVYAGNAPYPAIMNNSEYKAAVRGLRDSASGTYTGSASAVMENPSDLVRFALINSGLCLGVPSSDVDLTSFTATRVALGATHNMSFAIQKQTKADAFIQILNTQSDTVLVKTRAGKLQHIRERWHGNVFDYIMSQGRLRDELRIVSIVETPLDQVYNDFRINFGVDELKIPKDPALIRRAGSDSFSAAVYMSPTESSFPDPGRQAKLLESQRRYGVLQYRADFDCYAADSPAPWASLRRLVDRHCLQTLRVTISVPLREFYDIDLFYKLSARHVDLPLTGGTSERFVWTDNGTPIEWFNKGVPVVWLNLGNLEGQVYSLIEQDQDMQISFETQNPF